MRDIDEAYEKRRAGIRRAVVWKPQAPVIAEALFNGVGCHPVEMSGRGRLQCFSYPGGEGLIRPYLRGGLMRHFLRDAYVLANRPWREFEIHRYLFENGLRMPRLLGVCWERRGILVRGALATERLDARDLLEMFQEPRAEAESMAQQCGALIRQMHDLHVWHADLQVKNILVGRDGPYLIDFDNAVRRAHLSPLLRARNLLRLKRSLEKNGLPLEYFSAICAGYGEALLPEWLIRAYRHKGWFSDWITRQ